MVSGRHSITREPDGSFFIDRDGTYFRYILNYLRDGGFRAGTLPLDPAARYTIQYNYYASKTNLYAMIISLTVLDILKRWLCIYVMSEGVRTYRQLGGKRVYLYT